MILDALAGVGDRLFGRVDGPMSLRLILQPTAAVLLAIRAGLRDAREGRTPYLWSVFTSSGNRRGLLRQGWKDIGKVFVIAVILDAAYQWIVLYRVSVIGALLIAAILAILPYLIVRGPVTRLARRRSSNP